MALQVHPAYHKRIINLRNVNHLLLKEVEEYVDNLDDLYEEKYLFMVQKIVILSFLEPVVAN